MRRSRRSLLIVLAVLAALLVSGAILVQRLLEPARLSAFLLERAGQLTGLNLQLDSPAQIGFWPDLHLELTGLSASAPDAATPMLRVARTELSLPWASLTADQVALQNLRLIEPAIDWAALNDWLAREGGQAGPPASPMLPTFDAAVQIVQGRIESPDFRIEALDLSLPYLIENRSTTLSAKGRWVRGETTQPFALTLQTMPAWNGGQLRLAPLALGLVLDGSGIEPLALDGEVSWNGQYLAFIANSQLRQWPSRWPTLPLPDADEAIVEFALSYTGDASLRGDAALGLQRGGDAITASLRLGDLVAWLEGDGNALPPLTGSIDAARLHVEGIDIDGFRLRFDDPGDAKTDTGNASKSKAE